jgi:hypothetical protein
VIIGAAVDTFGGAAGEDNTATRSWPAGRPAREFSVRRADQRPAGLALFALLMGSDLVTPLFPEYAKVYGLSPLGVSLLFATYAVLVIPALLIFGPIQAFAYAVIAICLAGLSGLLVELRARARSSQAQR